VPAYLVYVCREVTDRQELEGEPVDGVAVVEFPSMQAAKAWYDSPAYRAIRPHRLNGARYIGRLVEGGALPPAQRMPQTKDRKRADRKPAGKDDDAEHL
jgi:hypothetical protein